MPTTIKPVITDELTSFIMINDELLIMIEFDNVSMGSGRLKTLSIKKQHPYNKNINNK